MYRVFEPDMYFGEYRSGNIQKGYKGIVREWRIITQPTAILFHWVLKLEQSYGLNLIPLQRPGMRSNYTPQYSRKFLFLLANRNKIIFQPQSNNLFISVALHHGNYLPAITNQHLTVHELIEYETCPRTIFNKWGNTVYKFHPFLHEPQ